MSTLTITGSVLVKEGHVDTVRAELEKLIPITRNETGCLQYDLHQDNENPHFFMFYENRSNRDLWQQHMQNDHLSAYMDATEGMVEKFWNHEMTRIA